MNTAVTNLKGAPLHTTVIPPTIIAGITTGPATMVAVRREEEEQAEEARLMTAEVHHMEAMMGLAGPKMKVTAISNKELVKGLRKERKEKIE